MIVLVGLLASAMMAQSAAPQALCGRTYDSMTQLRKELGADKDVARFAARDWVTTFYDRKAMTLWWIYSRQGHTSVATCKRKVATDNGYVDGPVEADCNSDEAGKCAAQAQRMVGVKF